MEITIELSGFSSLSVPSSFTIPTLPFIETASFSQIQRTSAPRDFEHLIVVGQGGSVNSLRALLATLPHTKKVHLIDTPDPYRLYSVKEQAKHSCLVMPISKSGDTLSVLENTLYFNGLPMHMITGNNGALYEIAKALRVSFTEHPPVGGRFIGNTVPCILPAFLAGIDVERVLAGAKACYQYAFNKDLSVNKALLVALALYNAEQRQLLDVYMPIYDYRLSGTKEFVMQICHETYCKQSRGQTWLIVEAPECQHHTNQRYFGGPRNTVGCFMSVQEYDGTSNVFIPESCSSISVHGKPLATLQGISHQYALHAELTGVMGHAKQQDMPYIHIVLDRIDPYHIGYYIAFWQLVSVYSAALRQVNPFDQPEVERSKEITRNLLLQK